MKKLLLLLFVSTIAFSQTKSIKKSPHLYEAKPSSAGMSVERLDRIDAMLKNAIDKQEIPGAVALIARNGKIVYYKAFGIADRKSKKLLKKDAIFRIASQTKAITSTAVMMLWEQGLFQLDDPISKYIPEFKDAQILDTFNEADSSYTSKPVTKKITIRHLITHTSGIGYGFIDSDSRIRKIYQKTGIIDAFTDQPITIKENIKKLAKLPLHFNPGEKYSYSEGLDVLGYFIEVISGKPLDVFFKEHIFDPLGMNDTRFYFPESKSNRLVSIQTKKDNKWENYTSNLYETDFPVKGAKTFFSGGGGLSSTAKDYATFLQMYLNNGELNGVRFLSRTTIQFMMANHIGKLWGGSGAYHGLAFMVTDQKGQDKGGRGSKGTFEWGGYFNTVYFADPKEQTIGILMKQTIDIGPDSTGWRFRQLVGQAIDD